MKVVRTPGSFRPVTVTLESEAEVMYLNVLLNIRKGDALKTTQLKGANSGNVASRTEMRDRFNSGI